jgi:YggT family protein
MPDAVREVRTETHADGPVRVDRQAVTERSADEPVFKAQQIVYLIYGVLTGLLVIRIVLSLLGANRGNGFANFIYSITNPFVSPFRGLFGYRAQYGVSRFEVESIVAIIVYGLVTWLIIKIFELTKRNPQV